MTKIDIGVGDEFPLDESRPGDRRDHHNHHHRRHHGRRHHRHHHHGFGLLALLLVAGGIAMLIASHRFTPQMAFALMGAGAGLMLLRGGLHAVWHWRRSRPAPQAGA